VTSCEVGLPFQPVLPPLPKLPHIAALPGRVGEELQHRIGVTLSRPICATAFQRSSSSPEARPKMRTAPGRMPRVLGLGGRKPANCYPSGQAGRATFVQMKANIEPRFEGNARQLHARGQRAPGGALSEGGRGGRLGPSACTTIVTTVCQSLGVVARCHRWPRIEYGAGSRRRSEYLAEGVCKASAAGPSPTLASSIRMQICSRPVLSSSIRRMMTHAEGRPALYPPPTMRG
jgi:hypothetical protein